jgi:hypothetical protein
VRPGSSFLGGVLAPALLAGAGLGGCASKGDVQMVQGEVALLKAEMARRDSARAADLGEVIRLQRQVMDSLAVNRRAVAQLKGDLSSDLYNIQQQLVQLQELTGQSQSGSPSSAPVWRRAVRRSRPRLRCRVTRRHPTPPAGAPRPTRCTRLRWRSFGAAASPPRGSGSER